MQYRTLGKHDLNVSALSLGTVALGMVYGISPGAGTPQGLAPPSRNEATRLIHAALAGGVNHIDTARGYGDSEAVVGHALRGKREGVIITTKASGFAPDGSILRGSALEQAITHSLETSLKLLQTDRVDVLMLHSAPAELLADGEALGVLQQLKQRGLTRLIGASTYGVEAPMLAIAQGAEVLQIAFNIFDQAMAVEVMPKAQETGVGIVVRSVFLKGALTSRAEDLPDHLRILKERSAAVATYVSALAPAMTREEAALRYVMSHPLAATALVGVRNVAELDVALAAAAQPPLSGTIMAKLDEFGWDSPLLNPGNWGIP